jgi:hypothetical protein
MKVSILSKLDTRSSISFIYPIFRWEKNLKLIDIEISIFNKVSKNIYETDVLIIDSNFYRGQRALTVNYVDKEIQILSENIKTLIWYDLSDSTALDNPWPLAYVDIYLKNQMLIDKSKYLLPIKSNGRVFSDYYILQNYVQEGNNTMSVPVNNKDLLKKLKLGWNSYMYDESLLNKVFLFLRKKFQIKNLIDYKNSFYKPNTLRDNNYFTRFNTNYSKESISWHRKETLKILNNYCSLIKNEKVSHRRYLSELKCSKIAIAPFGWGEFSYRDYETFIFGALLLKPDMSHSITWPNLYIENETYIPYSWNLENLAEQLEIVLLNDNMRISVAETGQENIKKYTVGKESFEFFCNQFLKVIKI